MSDYYAPSKAKLSELEIDSNKDFQGKSLYNYYEYIVGAGEVLLISHDEQKGLYLSDFVKVKTITINELVPSPNILRVRFAIWSADGNTVYGQIYRNGSPYGTLRSTTSTSPVTYTEDLEFAKGDTIELWCKGPKGVYFKNFRVYADYREGNKPAFQGVTS